MTLSVPRGRSGPHQQPTYLPPGARPLGSPPRGHPGANPGAPGFPTDPGLRSKQGRRELGPPRARAPGTAGTRRPLRVCGGAKQAAAPTATRQRFRGTHPGREAGPATVPSRRFSSLSSASLSGATLHGPEAGVLRHFRWRKCPGGRLPTRFPDEEQISQGFWDEDREILSRGLGYLFLLGISEASRPSLLIGVHLTSVRRATDHYRTLDTTRRESARDSGQNVE